MKKYLSLVILFVCCLVISAIALPAKADSGWDSSYDSGGSWDSGSSWDSDSSWDSGSSWDSDYSSSGDGDAAAIFITFFIIIFVIVVISSFNQVSRGSTSVVTEYYSYKDVDDFLISSIGYEKNELKKELFTKFVEIQNCWMEFDYDGLKKLCTDELYNMYKSQLTTLKLKNGKNIMHDFDLDTLNIYNIEDKTNQIVVQIYMRVSFYDYVINTKSCDVIRGKKYQPITNNYIMTFVKGKINTHSTMKCPSCGADVHVNARGECEYCNSVIVKDADNFVLSKKTNIN